MRSDFINSITHEFNTPLSAIIIANKGLQNPKLAALPENISSLTGVIERQSTRLKTLVNQVLDVTAINRLKLDIETYSLHELLDNILLDYKLNLRDSNVELTFSRSAQNDTVALDQFYFTTALLNILNNAIKYNDKKVKHIQVTTQNENDNILLSVSDNGIGISKEMQRHIFNKFYRIKNKKAQEAQGLGLGLYYVKQCVLAHKWDIAVTSEAKEGTTFTISIPLKKHS
jgi:two-component system phosphate regulon sensor histidine kinase PhoR